MPWSTLFTVAGVEQLCCVCWTIDVCWRHICLTLWRIVTFCVSSAVCECSYLLKHLVKVLIAASHSSWIKCKKHQNRIRKPSSLMAVKYSSLPFSLSAFVCSRSSRLAFSSSDCSTDTYTTAIFHQITCTIQLNSVQLKSLFLTTHSAVMQPVSYEMTSTSEQGLQSQPAFHSCRPLNA